MCRALKKLGAKVIGYSLEPPTEPSLYNVLNISNDIIDVRGDIRDLEHLKAVFENYKPEIVIHMAAQPIVRESYKNPVLTYETNVVGTVNVLECVRLFSCVRSFVNVTTDKVYLNRELGQPFTEDDRLCGYDPYSNSKSCSELVTYSYKNSFFGGVKGVDCNGRKISVSTCRAGNVIGGGDFASDRIVPDCYRACVAKKDIIVRNPYSIRPYQHVIEPVMCYLYIAMLQYDDSGYADNYNIGPKEDCFITTGELTDKFCKIWNNDTNDDFSAKWVNVSDNGPHEASFLKLDCTKVLKKTGWENKLSIDETMNDTVLFYRYFYQEKDVSALVDRQIENYMKLL